MSNTAPCPACAEARAEIDRLRQEVGTLRAQADARAARAAALPSPERLVSEFAKVWRDMVEADVHCCSIRPGAA